MTEVFSQCRLKLALRDYARKNLLPFTAYTKPDYTTNWHHEELAKKLDLVASGRCPRLMVFMPPQHGKSELVSRRFPAFMLGRNPDLRLICASHTYELAVSMNRDVQRIMTSDAYGKVFSETMLDAYGTVFPGTRLDVHQKIFPGIRLDAYGKVFPGIRLKAKS